ncbi:hypothetical protein G6F24_015054 [Rhizopus arrhizus]|nr:hypothetical protein G6F24_015054 [Rhizopus arrhizus]
MNNINNIKIACTCTECSMHPGGFRRLAKRTVLTHKRLDKFRGRESRRQTAEAMQQSTAVPENESEHTTFEDHMNVDGEEELSHATQHFPTFDGTGIQVWKNQYEPVSRLSILPIHRIYNPVAVKSYIDNHILTLSLPRKIYM